VGGGRESKKIPGGCPFIKGKPGVDGDIRKSLKESRRRGIPMRKKSREPTTNPNISCSRAQKDTETKSRFLESSCGIELGGGGSLNAVPNSPGEKRNRILHESHSKGGGRLLDLTGGIQRRRKYYITGLGTKPRRPRKEFEKDKGGKGGVLKGKSPEKGSPFVAFS